MCVVKEYKKSPKKLIMLTHRGPLTSEWFDDIEDQYELYETLCKKHDLNREEIKKCFVSFYHGEKDCIYISEHAFTRLKERNGWNRKTSLRMMSRVFETGKNIKDIKGYLLPWIKQRLALLEDGEYAILYGQDVYIFNDNILVTVFPAPSKGYNYYLKNITREVDY